MVREKQRLRHIHARTNPGRPYPSYRYPRRHHRRRFRRIVWPRRRYIVYYNRGPRFTFRYAYPHHHRKYLFVSFGGYWPMHYRYLRYYWYGYHPYRWYGYSPVPYRVEGDTYNYYTYNYYNSTTAAESTQVADGIRPVDENTFADVRERLARESAKEPDAETAADRYFDEGVEAFEAGNYGTAADKFAEAVDIEPDDVVLPFAYVQALFANQQYAKAAEVLRDAINQLPTDKEDVFFPRGLYPDDDALFEQIDHLAGEADLHPPEANMQLLLG